MLKGLQLKFTNGVETPVFQKDALEARVKAGRAVGKWALKSADIDVSKKISKVSVKVRQDQYFMDGLRLIDEFGGNILDLKWCDSNDSEWQTRSVPEDKEIIGLYMSKKGHDEAIQSFGFILWTPNPNATE